MVDDGTISNALRLFQLQRAHVGEVEVLQPQEVGGRGNRPSTDTRALRRFAERMIWLACLCLTVRLCTVVLLFAPAIPFYDHRPRYERRQCYCAIR